jgi:hypothetical protein
MRFKSDALAEREMMARMQQDAALTEKAEGLELLKRKLVKPSPTGNRRQRRAAMARAR